MASGSASDLWVSIRCCMACIALVLGMPSASGAQSNETPLRISPETAVSLALANNLSLESARRTPEIADFGVRAASSVWVPSVVATLGQARADSPASTSFDRGLDVLSHQQVTSNVSVNQLLPWGASYEVGWSSIRSSNNSLVNLQPELNTTATARVTQPLLRGFAIDTARADRARSLQTRDRAGFALDGTVTALKREVLYAYWQWVYTRGFRDVAAEAQALARALLAGNRERVAARAMAATDVIEAEAEVARRDEAVIVAVKNVANAEDQLRLLILNPHAPEYHMPLEPADVTEPETAVITADTVTRALAERNDLKILKSTIETNTLDVRQLRNEALPDVNLSAGFSAGAVGLVLGDLGQLRYPGWSMQVSVGYPVNAVVAKADAAQAQVEKRQSELSLAALEQRVETEVRTAQREVETNEKRLQSTAVAVALAERRLAAEEEKFLVGLSTSFFVFQAQRDLASARVARLGAVLDRRLSLADLEAVQSAPLKPIR